MTSIRAFCDLARDLRPHSIATLRRRFGAGLDVLESQALLVRGPLATLISCGLCDTPHPVQPYSDDAGGWLYECGYGVPMPVREDELETQSLDLPTALRLLRDALAPSVGSPPLRMIPPENLWLVAETEIQSAMVTVYVALDGGIGSLLNALQFERPDRSIVLCVGAPSLRTKANDHHFAALQDFVALEAERGFILDRRAVGNYLGISEPKSSKPGRKPKYVMETFGAIASMTNAELRLSYREIENLAIERTPERAQTSHGRRSTSLSQLVRVEIDRLRKERGIEASR